ncbi:MAG TPA: trigger factor [Stellaceae bacterium]|nr:trigger factor [Stellaceae bacterium]
MNVTETSAEGLKRELTITVPANEVDDKVTRRLGEIGQSVRIPGFRPGKVPMTMLRQRFGPAVRGEVLETTVQDSSAEAMREQNLRPALPPRVEIVSAAEGADFEYKISVELLPEMPEPDFAGLGLEKLVADVPEEDVDRAVARLAESQRKSEPVERPAEAGDILVADVVGRLGAEEIAGSRGEGRQIELGAEGLLPGFTDQLVGIGAGETREVRVTFPEDYGNPDMAGKDGVFEVAVKEVRHRLPPALDDELAKAVGLDTLTELRQEVRQRMQRDYAGVARQRLKRALLDKLAERYDFGVPPGMVEIEFNSIWAQYEADKARREQTPAVEAGAAPNPPQEGAVEAAVSASEPAGEPVAAAAGDSPAIAEGDDEEKTKADFRRIAERRVRLGLLLAEVGRSNNITVSQEELNQALTQEARRLPGYERQVIDYYRKNPDAMSNLRAPIFEDKVVDFIVELAKPEERKVTPQELMTGAEADGESAPVA